MGPGKFCPFSRTKASSQMSTTINQTYRVTFGQPNNIETREFLDRFDAYECWRTNCRHPIAHIEIYYRVKDPHALLGGRKTNKLLSGTDADLKRFLKGL